LTKYWLGKKRGPMSDECKAKISLALKEVVKKRDQNNRNNLVGTTRIMSEEGKKRMSEGQKGKKFSKEHIEKLRITSTGRKYSNESRNKISLGKLGEKNPMWKGGVTKLPDYSFNTNLRRRLLLKKAGGSHTRTEWELLKRQYGYICPSCNRSEPLIKLTKDHIIPVIKGGSNFIENIQPLCFSCNRRKQTKIVKYAIYVEK
jgi:5-methylcytosine-specific restriction endonuclease McrA